MPQKLRYETKIVGVSQVVLEGYLEYVFTDDYEGWVVKPSFGAQDELNTWLNKFDKGHRMVRITIEYLSNQDESHLLPKGS